MTKGPPFDPNMDLPGIPDDWRVLWCPGCGYSVAWDQRTVVEERNLQAFTQFVHLEAAFHDCIARSEGSA